ncbi:MAG: Asp-tRNA(Asn)/Glu-tRNA(Gln) amidotransferase subunit GatC [Candidatus Aenigmarchaeota archaeon]|nr:Asp-tRNA(Asn)/Glu-tRNA(Gln) amidotransferase subunit GatC [Candidatus Aenigmarchaeota archaeon]
MSKAQKKASAKKITADVVLRVAKTARLDLTDAEVKKFQKDLNEILSAFRELDKAKPPENASFQPIPMKDVTREDSAEKCLTQDEALANTKHKQDGYFKGPRAV